MFLPEQIEYFAENELISVLPQFASPIIHLMSGDFGPFIPLQAIQVPLWFAIILRKGNNCTIIPPEWFTTEHLEKCLEIEKKEKDGFCSINFHYLEVSSMLLEEAAEDLVKPESLRKLIQSLREVRMQKIISGIKELDGRPMNLNNISMMELNEIKPLFFEAMNKMNQLTDAIDVNAEKYSASRSM